MANRFNKQLHEDIRLILSNQPGLRCVYKETNPWELCGEYKVLDDRNQVQECFQVRIILPRNYPYGFPILVETSGKIERIDDRHISSDGVACLEMDRKIAIIAKRGIRLAEFFKNFVHKFFCWQILYDAGEKETLLGWSHNDEGAIEFYLEFLGTKSKDQVIRILELIKTKKLPGRNAFCPCDSGKKIKRCHEKIFQDLKSIGQVQLQKDLALFRKTVA